MRFIIFRGGKQEAIGSFEISILNNDGSHMIHIIFDMIKHIVRDHKKFVAINKRSLVFFRFQYPSRSIANILRRLNGIIKVSKGNFSNIGRSGSIPLGDKNTQ